MAYKRAGFTLIEIMIVMVIIGILVAIGLPSYTKIKEQALDKEAKVNLKLIQAAEKIYRMEIGAYWGTSDRELLNRDLKLDLPKTDTRNWDYTTYSDGLATAERFPGGDRTWELPIDEEDPELQP